MRDSLASGTLFKTGSRVHPTGIKQSISTSPHEVESAHAVEQQPFGGEVAVAAGASAYAGAIKWRVDHAAQLIQCEDVVGALPSGTARSAPLESTDAATKAPVRTWTGVTSVLSTNCTDSSVTSTTTVSTL